MKEKALRRVWFYSIACGFIRLLMRLITRCEIRGKENIPSSGPVIVVANHLTLADPPVLAACLGRQACFMAKQELFHYSLVNLIFRGFGAFPIHRGRLDVRGMRKALEILNGRQVLALFPEGHRTRTGGLQLAPDGTALLATRSHAPILPVAISGTEKLKWGWWARPRILVNIGPVFYPEINGKLSRKELNLVTTDIMKHIAELLPPRYRGVYA